MTSIDKPCLCDLLEKDVGIFLNDELRNKMLRYSKKLNRETFSGYEENLIRLCFKYKIPFLKKVFPGVSEHIIFLNLNHYLSTNSCIFCKENYH